MKKTLLALTVLLVSPVWAGDDWLADYTLIDYSNNYKQIFGTPSGNVICGGDSYKRKTAKWYAHDLYCFVDEMQAMKKSCKGYGYDFAFNRTGKPKKGCASFDKPAHYMSEWGEDWRTLQYGETVKGDGWSCTALKTGMRCQNDEGHGFLLNKTSYQFF